MTEQEGHVTNPVIIFIVPDSFQLDSDNLADGLFPIGWTDSGELHRPTEEGKNYCLIALNDRLQTVPKLQHANKIGNAPLVVITHKNSVHHCDPRNILNGYGRPQLGISFSHISGDLNPIFEEIKECFCTPGRALEFAQKHRNHSSYRTWERLAALCQLMLLEPATGFPATQRIILNDLHPTEAEEYKSIKKDNVPDWTRRLKHAMTKANASCPK